MKGFTLLELLIAVAIFAILGALAYGGLTAIAFQENYTRQHFAQLTQLQRAFTFFQQDLSQIVPKSIRNNYSDAEPALKGSIVNEYLIEFTRAGWPNPTELARSEMVRIAYYIEEEQLKRLIWYYPDYIYAEPSKEMILLDNVEELTINYLYPNNDWKETWPPTTGSTPLDLPYALEFNITVKGIGEIKRIWLLE